MRKGVPVGERRVREAIRHRSGDRFWGARGRSGRSRGVLYSVWRFVSKDSGRISDWLTYLAAAAVGNGEDLALRGRDNTLVDPVHIEHLCVDL